MEEVFMPHVDKINDEARFLRRHKGWFQSIRGGDSFGVEHVTHNKQGRCLGIIKTVDGKNK